MLRREELLTSPFLEFLEARDLARAEVAGAVPSSSLHLDRAWRRLGISTGAVHFRTRGVVGKGTDAKADYSLWARERATFFGGLLLRGVSSTWIQELATRIDSLGSGRTLFETHRRLTSSSAATRHRLPLPAGPQNPVGSNSIPQLPDKDRPMLPLSFGIRPGYSLYAEFRLHWQEHGNGEMCQLGLVSSGLSGKSAPDDPIILFSPSAGSVARRVRHGALSIGTFRAWPLPDLWLDIAPVGNHSVLEAGIFVGPSGQVTFFRRGPVSESATEKGFADLPWEVTASFDWSLPPHAQLLGLGDVEEATLKPRTEELHVVLTMLDEVTPLRAELSHVGCTPPVPAPTSRYNDEWRWHAD